MAKQPVLRRIGVLILVDERVRVACLPSFCRLAIAIEQRGGQHDQIVEVDRLIRRQRRTVLRVRSGGFHLAVVAGGGLRLARRGQRVLPPADLPLRGAHACAVGGRQELGDDRLQIRGIEHGKARSQSQQPRFAPNDRETERMERGDRNGVRLIGAAEQ